MEEGMRFNQLKDVVALLKARERVLYAEAILHDEL